MTKTKTKTERGDRTERQFLSLSWCRILGIDLRLGLVLNFDFAFVFVLVLGLRLRLSLVVFIYSRLCCWCLSLVFLPCGFILPYSLKLGNDEQMHPKSCLPLFFFFSNSGVRTPGFSVFSCFFLLRIYFS